MLALLAYVNSTATISGLKFAWTGAWEFDQMTESSKPFETSRKAFVTSRKAVVTSRKVFVTSQVLESLVRTGGLEPPRG
jgi:hypothetical protein